MWARRVLLVIGGFVIATPGGGIMPISQLLITSLGLAILIPTILVAWLLVRRQPLGESLLRDCSSVAKIYGKGLSRELARPA